MSRWPDSPRSAKSPVLFAHLPGALLFSLSAIERPLFPMVNELLALKFRKRRCDN